MPELEQPVGHLPVTGSFPGYHLSARTGKSFCLRDDTLTWQCAGWYLYRAAVTHASVEVSVLLSWCAQDQITCSFTVTIAVVIRNNLICCAPLANLQLA